MPKLQSDPSFDRMLTDLKSAPDWQQLPDIRVAMSPDHVSFGDDVSDTTMFNERYIESHVFIGKMAFALYGTCGAFVVTSAFSATAIMFDVLAKKSLGEIIFLNGILVAFSALMATMTFFFSKLEPVCVRFNRQAQLVHIYRSPGKADTAAWREVHPFTKFRPSGEGSFSLKLVFRTGPADWEIVPGAFDFGDEACLAENLLRLEFLRRYMAEGLSAIQPDPTRTRYKPSGFSKAVTLKEDGLLALLFAKFVALPGYYLGCGPLIDRYLLRRAANVQWPAEVERLCAPGADLSGYDTTPVQAHKKIFHRFNGRDLDLVDINGNVLG
jgi:hypothetical protein